MAGVTYVSFEKVVESQVPLAEMVGTVVALVSKVMDGVVAVSMLLENWIIILRSWVSPTGDARLILTDSTLGGTTSLVVRVTLFETGLPAISVTRLEGVTSSLPDMVNPSVISMVTAV